MNLLTPANACIKLIDFIERIERLEKNQYTITRFYSYDMGILKEDLNKINLYCSIAIWNKNKERAEEIINLVEGKIIIARDLLYKNKLKI